MTSTPRRLFACTLAALALAACDDASTSRSGGADAEPPALRTFDAAAGGAPAPQADAVPFVDLGPALDAGASPVPDAAGQPPDSDATGPSPDALVVGQRDDAAVSGPGGGEIPAPVQAAIDAALAASDAAVTAFCDCYRDAAPYNGDDRACRAELDGIAVHVLACDADVAAMYPDDAAAFYACRQQVAETMGACFAGCAGRIPAVTGCVVTAATSAVGCGSGVSAAFVSAYEACHP